MSGLDVYHAVVSDADPEKALNALTNDEMETLIEWLWLLDNPNNFQAHIYAMSMVCVLGRWKKLIRS